MDHAGSFHQRSDFPASVWRRRRTCTTRALGEGSATPSRSAAAQRPLSSVTKRSLGLANDDRRQAIGQSIRRDSRTQRAWQPVRRRSSLRPLHATGEHERRSAIRAEASFVKPASVTSIEHRKSWAETVVPPAGQHSPGWQARPLAFALVGSAAVFDCALFARVTTPWSIFRHH